MDWFWRKRREQELEREIRSDLELEADELREAGLPADAARAVAHKAFGNVAFTQEEVRKVWGWTRCQILLQDLRYALRNLRKSPGFAAAAILTLALGIGASTAVFTVVDSVLLKPLGYHDSGSLVAAWERIQFVGNDNLGPNLRHVDVWRQRSTAFRGLAYLQSAALGLMEGSGHPALVAAVACAPSLFDVLEVQPLLGRTFVADDGVRGRDRVAVITYPLWQSLFHGDPQVAGKTIRLGSVSRQVVGVLPEGFHFPSATALSAFKGAGQATRVADEPAVFFPTPVDLAELSWNGDYGNWVVLGRLRSGVTPALATAQVNAIEEQLVREMRIGPKNQPKWLQASVQPMQEAMVGGSRTGLWMLMAAVLGLMLIACLNLANAQLGRALGRNRETAVRTALGAARWRLMWSELAESLVLGAAGGAGGILLAFVGLDLFRRYAPIDLPRMAEIHPNLVVLLFSMALTIGASVISGVLPAVRMLAGDPADSLAHAGRRTAGSRQSKRIRRLLIAAQVAGCTVLLLVTGLFTKSLLHLLNQERGFETGGVMAAQVQLATSAYGPPQNRVLFDDAVLANLRAIPGVQSAAMMSAMPLNGESWVESAQRVDQPNREGPLINLRWVSPGYFETTGQRLVAGRFFEERDRNLSSAVLSESEARALWPGESALGGQVRIEGRTFTVIGVVSDSRNTSLKSPPPRMAYIHYKDRPPLTTFFVVRAAATGNALAASIREAIWKYDREVTIARVKTLDAQLADSLGTERFQTGVLLVFGAAALLLAMLGIYGVLSYSVAARRQEIGVRMALGATRGLIYAQTFGEASLPVLSGLAVGLGASYFAGRIVRNLLYGVKAADPVVIAVVAALFLASASAAALLPARRAASVDPMEALRAD